EWRCRDFPDRCARRRLRRKPAHRRAPQSAHATSRTTHPRRQAPSRPASRQASPPPIATRAPSTRITLQIVLALQIILQAHLIEVLELCLEEIDVLFGVVEQLDQ